MNKLSTRIKAICLCEAIMLTGTGAAYAITWDNTEASAKAVAAAPETDETKDVSKDETVYVLAGADGSVHKVIVSDWIKNGLNENSIADKSGLSDIESVKGDAAYTMNGNNMTVWDAAGNDIYYQGNIDKELPVTLSVSYKLDGKPISSDDIAGKSGRVTIRFDYENLRYETVSIDGRDEKIYVPFGMLTGMLLNNDAFRNVEVSNGKLLNDGDRTAVIGIAFPGLQENLGIDKDKFKLPDYVEIAADVTNFELGMTVTIATNEIFNELDAKNADSADGLTSSLNELTDGMQKLLDGSSALYDGLCTLLDKSKELVRGIEKLADGAKALKEGTVSLDSGAAQLQAGAGELSVGLATLASNNFSLNGGARQVFDTLLSTATAQLNTAGISVPTLTIENYAEVLNGVIASLDKTAVYNQALEKVSAEVEKNRPLIEQKVTEAVREQVEAQVTAAAKEQVASGVTATVKEQVYAQVVEAVTGMSKADYDAAVAAGIISEEQQSAVAAAVEERMKTEQVQDLIEANIAAQMDSADIKAMIAANTEAQMQSEAVKQTIAENVELQTNKAISDNMASDAVQSQLSAASEGARSIISLKSSLDSYNAFYIGLLTYTDGVAAAANGAATLFSGASELKGGTAQLKEGASSLYAGIMQLKNGAPALMDGVTKLKNGAMQLSDGLQQFDEEGIQKIVDLVDGDIEGVLARVRATVDVSKNYRNFSGISDNMDGRVKFVYRTDEIKAG